MMLLQFVVIIFKIILFFLTLDNRFSYYLNNLILGLFNLKRKAKNEKLVNQEQYFSFVLTDSNFLVILKVYMYYAKTFFNTYKKI